MADSRERAEFLKAELAIAIPLESRTLIAMSPAELRIRSVYNHLTTFGVACLGMFVPLLALLVVPSPCTPHFDAYLAATVVIGFLAVVSLGYAFYGNRQEAKLRYRQ